VINLVTPLYLASSADLNAVFAASEGGGSIKQTWQYNLVNCSPAGVAPTNAPNNP